MEDETSELARDPVDRNDNEAVEDQEARVENRGRKKIPDQWTRVISLSTDNLNESKIFPIATDLLLN